MPLGPTPFERMMVIWILAATMLLVNLPKRVPKQYERLSGARRPGPEGFMVGQVVKFQAPPTGLVEAQMRPRRTVV